MSILESLIEQSRNPNNRIGKIMLSIMNKAHIGRTKYILNKLGIQEGQRILDIGCGGGETIRALATMQSNTYIYGIDYSETSVKMTKEKNRKDVQAGRVHVLAGEVSRLPFEDNDFNVITAIQTHYYWPDLKNDVKEIFRVLNTQGKLLIASELYKINYHMNSYKTIAEMEDLLRNTGFDKVTIEEDGKWRYVIGVKK